MVDIITSRYANAAFRLHEHVLVYWSVIFTLHDHVRLGKALIHIPMAHLYMLQQIATLPLFVNQRGIALASLLCSSHNGKRFVCNVNQL